MLATAAPVAPCTCQRDRAPGSIRVPCDQRRQLTAIEYNELMGGRRKRGAAIAHELAQRQEDLDRYRPMPTKAKGTALEKQRLQNINMFKGGKALPDELTLAPIEGTACVGRWWCVAVGVVTYGGTRLGGAPV